MEYFIAVFVGVWVSAAGFLAYRQVNKDFSDVEKRKGETKK